MPCDSRLRLPSAQHAGRAETANHRMSRAPAKRYSFTECHAIAARDWRTRSVLTERLVANRLRTLLPGTLACKVLLRQFYHSTAQQEHTNEVRDSHKSVEGIGDIPQKSEIYCRSKDRNE